MIRALDPLVTLPATDPARAHAFYAGTLGLVPVVEVPETGFYIYRAGDDEQVRFIGIHRHAGDTSSFLALGRSGRRGAVGTWRGMNVVTGRAPRR